MVAKYASCKRISYSQTKFQRFNFRQMTKEGDAKIAADICKKNLASNNPKSLKNAGYNEESINFYVNLHSESKWIERINSRYIDAFVLEDNRNPNNSRIAATIYIKWCGGWSLFGWLGCKPHYAYVGGLYVNEDYLHYGGVGSFIWKSTEQQILSRQTNLIKLITFQNAIKFYERIGFKNDGEITNSAFCSYHMHKRLN